MAVTVRDWQLEATGAGSRCQPAQRRRHPAPGCRAGGACRGWRCRAEDYFFWWVGVSWERAPGRSSPSAHRILSKTAPTPSATLLPLTSLLSRPCTLRTKTKPCGAIGPQVSPGLGVWWEAGPGGGGATAHVPQMNEQVAWVLGLAVPRSAVTGRPASSRSSFTQFAKDTGNVVRESFNTASVGFLLGLTSELGLGCMGLHSRVDCEDVH